MMQINAKKLIALRKSANLTAEALAEEAHVGRATITRIENGHTTSSSRNTVEQLARVFRCRPQELSTPPEAEAPDGLFPNRQVAKIEMSVACRNALSLIAIRYGEKASTILELAPLLFDIVARESLIERRRNLAELKSHREAIYAMSDRFPHIGRRLTYDGQAEEFDEREEHSIACNDLRGTQIQFDEMIHEYFEPEDYEDDCSNPFIAHLRCRYERIAQEGFEAARIDAIMNWIGPVYELGLVEALSVTGGDEELAKAIIHGVIQLSSIPKDYLKADRLTDRQLWMRERIQEEEALRAASRKELDGIEALLGL